MKRKTVNINGVDMALYSLNTVIVGSGAAGFNAADSLYSLGQNDIAIITEGVKMGTSRNTGSDKQTYYKQTLSGDGKDSVAEMAETLFAGGCMHGDIALAEAALSARSFYKLVEAGVPFPHNRYGEYIGYKTDHDPRQRATSAGPLTSRFMTERLEAKVVEKGITIFNGFQVIGILTQKEANGDNASAIGLVALDMNSLEAENKGFTLLNCTNIIYATGGPAGMYKTSVYPESQTGASGIAFEVGARGINLTESQYGLASVKFRWNLSGTYQQVLPRYVSTNRDGTDEREFLDEYFRSEGKMLDAIFLKGYQWPFDPRKVESFGSSLIDILVYNETQNKGRRVFLDFTRNPSAMGDEPDFSSLGDETYTYLKNSGALFGSPIQRLRKMNPPAIELYRNNGIDLEKEYLEMAVCAQHNNGGLMGNLWWESNLRHLFPVGEVNGTFGVYRPGGSALNSTQTGSLRAAQYINANYTQAPLSEEVFLESACNDITVKFGMAEKFTSKNSGPSNVLDIRIAAQERMTAAGAHIRSPEGVDKALGECRAALKSLAEETRMSSVHELPYAFQNWDILLTQFVYLNAIKEYIAKGGGSRGSYMIQDPSGRIPAEGLDESFRFRLDDGRLNASTCEVWLDTRKLECHMEWKPVRPIPKEDNWFENVWEAFRDGKVIT